MPILADHLELIAQLKDEPGYLLLCDHLQSLVDDLADDMAEPNVPTDILLQRVAEWKASRRFLLILKTYPQDLSREVVAQQEERQTKLPPELHINETFLARLLSHKKDDE